MKHHQLFSTLLKTLCVFCFSAQATQTTQKTIAVIGAGLAGLTTAHRLEKNGYSVSLYEARPRAGGRVFTCFFDNGHHEELGGQSLYDGGDALSILSLINEFNLETTALQYAHDKMYLDDDNNIVSFKALIKNGPKPTDEIYNSLKQKAANNISMHDLLDDFLGKNNILRSLMDQRTTGYEGCSTNKLSTHYFDSFWDYYKNTYEASLLETVNPPKELVTVKGGMCNLVQSLCNQLKDKIFYDMPLRKITFNQDKTLILTFDNAKTIEADIVVLAIPCSTLRDISIENGIVPADQLEMISTLQYGTNAKILIPLENKDHKNNVVYYGKNATGFVATKPVIWCYFGGEAGIFDSSNAKILTQILEQERTYLTKFYPNEIQDWTVNSVSASDKPQVHAHGSVGISWINEQFSKGSYSAIAPDQTKVYSKFSVYYGEKVRTAFRPVSPLFFAGEHTAINDPSTMEGAVESAERTARMVMRYLS